jgi:hypothetical protein
MVNSKRDPERDERIAMEIIADCYNESEQAMGWYYSLEERLRFPFLAKCSTKRGISPLQIHDKVKVVGMAPEEECEHEVFVLIQWERRRLCVPLIQLKPVDADEQTTQAVEDWHYWVERG